MIVWEQKDLPLVQFYTFRCQIWRIGNHAASDVINFVSTLHNPVVYLFAAKHWSGYRNVFSDWGSLKRIIKIYRFLVLSAPNGWEGNIIRVWGSMEKANSLNWNLWEACECAERGRWFYLRWYVPHHCCHKGRFDSVATTKTFFLRFVLGLNSYCKNFGLINEIFYIGNIPVLFITYWGELTFPT